MCRHERASTEPGSGTVSDQPAGTVVIDAQPQHRVPIQDGLEHHQHVVLGHPDRRLYQHGLVELIDRTLDVVQPPHDRGRLQRADTLIDHTAVAVGERRDPGQPGHRLLDEDITRPAQHTGGARPRDHLHRQDAVATEFEERVVDPDPLQPQHLGVDAGQDLLHRIRGSAVRSTILIFRRRQRTGIQFPVDRQRQRVQHHDRGRNHELRQPITQ